MSTREYQEWLVVAAGGTVDLAPSSPRVSAVSSVGESDCPSDSEAPLKLQILNDAIRRAPARDLSRRRLRRRASGRTRTELVFIAQLLSLKFISVTVSLLCRSLPHVRVFQQSRLQKLFGRLRVNT